MKIALSSPISHGIRLYTEVEVHLPGPHVDLARPPRGMSRLAWHVSRISDLPADAVRQLSEVDTHAILDGCSELITEMRAFSRALTSAHQKVEAA